MVRKHIKRDYSAHKKSVVRPMDEYVKLEIFSYNHVNTSAYSLYNNNISSKNTNPTTTVSWVCYESLNKTTRFDVACDYLATSNKEYRLDILYTSKDERDMLGYVQIFKDGVKIDETSVIFDGEVDVWKRQTLFYNLEEGAYTFNIRMPVNTYWLGSIIREIKLFTGDNIDSAGTNLQFTQASVSRTSETKPAEVSCTIGYDDSFECEYSNSDFYIDYHDEMNVYIKDDDGTLKQVFGGYVSSILPNTDRTSLTITGADRLIDGQNKYVLNEMFLLGGTTIHEDYLGEDYRDFQNFGGALKYLCDLFETTLKNNINENYLVGGEAYENAVTCTYGDEGNVKEVPVNNASVESNKNFITVRNNQVSDNYQVIYLYDYSDFLQSPVDITDYSNFFFTYGLGDPKTESELAEGVTINGAGVTDETITVNMMPSCGCCAGTAYQRYNKSWKNYCPNCGKTGTLTDNPKGVYEGEITCSMSKGGCDADYCGYCGGDKAGGGKCNRVKLTPADGSSGGSEGTVTPESVFQAITDEAFQYQYVLNGDTCSSFQCMQSKGRGECWAFSDLIYIRLKERGVASRIMQYPTRYSNNHRSVQYKDTNGGWQNFPYNDYGWGSRYSNMLNPTDGVWGGSVVAQCDGNGIDQATAGANGATKVINGYDKDKIFQGYFQIDFRCITQYGKVFDDYIVFDFSQISHNEASFGALDKGFDPIALNNSIKQATINAKQYILELCTRRGYIEWKDEEETKLYLRAIKLKAFPTNEQGINAPYYDDSGGSIDNASCKLDIYACGFNNGTLINPTDLSSCGKSLNSMIEELIKQSGYIVNIDYATHRKDDVINFKVDNQTTPMFTATEGDNSNILSWSNITYAPVTNLFNSSYYVFKKQTNNPGEVVYQYTNAKDSTSVLKYGEQTCLQSTSEQMSEAESYYYARVKNSKFNWNPLFTYTIKVAGCPDLDIQDLVKVIADAKKLNSVKRVKSIKISYSTSQIPRINTEIGLDEMSPDFQLQKALREMRESAKQESTLFSGSASKVDNSEVYQWER